MGSKWYSYEEKIWANAIILKDESTNNNYAVGATIPEEAIEAYFVWIPKYRYQLWDLGMYDSITRIDPSKVHEIPVIFGDYNTSDSVDGECTTPMESGATGNCNIGDYMTHPAFLSIPSKGFWVGKFETGYDGATSTSEAEINERDASKIIVKPNVYSWRGIQVANAFYSSYDYKRNLDSHMMKNTEWGAIAYLQHSKYGSGTNVRLNNNSASITGYQANNEPTCGYTSTSDDCNRSCNDGSCNIAYPNSILASTTNNISGIFDMSGGAWEYVMGVMLDENGKPLSGYALDKNSNFNGLLSSGEELSTGFNWPLESYYDKYMFYDNKTEDVTQKYQRRILGDATGEMGPFENQTLMSLSRHINSWYKQQGIFVNFLQSYFWRGSGYLGGTNAGLFAFSVDNGQDSKLFSFRLILTPN